MPWSDEVIQGFSEVNDVMQPVTFKDKLDGDIVTDVLIAPGHIEDIQPGVDHVHAWNQHEGEPDHHDLVNPPGGGWMPPV